MGSLEEEEEALRAVSADWRALGTLPQHLRSRRDVVLEAVAHFGIALKFAGDFQGDKDIVTRAVQQNGLALQFAARAFAADRDVVKIAVGQSGLALQFASNRLRADREIITCAVEQDGRSLRFSALQDRDIVLRAVQPAPATHHEKS